MKKTNKTARSGARGHLSDAQRMSILTAWRDRQTDSGVVTALARQFGVSHVTISNLILRETGKRPRFHKIAKNKKLKSLQADRGTRQKK